MSQALEMSRGKKVPNIAQSPGTLKAKQTTQAQCPLRTLTGKVNWAFVGQTLLGQDIST